MYIVQQYAQVKYGFDYSKKKDRLLKKARDISFEEVIEAIKSGNLIKDVDHFNKKNYPNQRIFIVKLRKYIYAVPYVLDKKRNVKFLKTIYPNRVLKKKYLK